MNLEDIAREILAFAGTFNIWLVLAIFLMLSIGEFGTSIPYVMETIWILAGYHTVIGTLSIPELLVLWLVAVAGRIVGTVALYQLAGLGRGPIMRLYHRFFGKVLSQSTPEDDNVSLPVRFFRRINLLSPYSVAFGRLIWLRVPLTLILSMRRELGVLLWAVLLASVVWDATYILIGVVGGNIQVKPTDIILYSLAGLTVIYGIGFIIRRLLRLRHPNPD
jgi:membrane-associated protein